MHPDELKNAALVYAALKEELIKLYDLQESDEVLLDTLEGATDLEEVIVRAIREAREAEAMAKAMDEILDANRARKKRHADRSERIREAVAKAMANVRMSAIKRPDLTISPSKVKGRLKVIATEALPTWAKIERQVTEVVPDMDAIQVAYEKNPDEFVCPGVEVVPERPNIIVKAR